MRRTLVLFAVLISACTSTWERHQNALAEHERVGNYEAAADEARWLIDNAFLHGPVSERSQRAEARQYLRLARLEARAGDPDAAIVSLRQALMTDPEAAPAVQRQVSELPLDSDRRQKVLEEFSWNLAALAPEQDLSGDPQAGRDRCWSYSAREVRVTGKRTVTRGGRAEHRVTYDARLWQFDADSMRWTPLGGWVLDAGTEVEYAGAQPEPRYRALVRAERHFYVDGRVPPCHRQGWDGPYDAERDRVFIATKLPVN